MSAEGADTGGTGGSGSASGADAAMRDAFDWYPIAKKEFADAVRSKGLWVLSALFTALFVLPAARVWWDQRGNAGQIRQSVQDIGMQYFISQIYLDTVTLLMTIVVLFVGYAAVTKERESGTLKLLLSQPFSRRDVVVGKVLGRAAVVAVPGAIAFAVTGFFFALSPFTFKLDVFLWFVLFTLVLVVVLVAIAVSISGALSKSVYSLAGGILVYIYANFAWNSLANTVGDLLSNQVGVGASVRWHVVLALKLLNPMQAYKTLTNSMLGEGSEAARTARYGMFQQEQGAMRAICGDVLNGQPATVQRGFLGNQTVCEAGSSGLPLYFSDAAVFLSLLLWVAVAAALSYYTFDRADL